MKVFVHTDINNKHTFYKSLDELNRDFLLNIDINTREEQNIESNRFYLYSTSDKNCTIQEYDFDEDETITFMECNDPDSDFCFLVKKKMLDFLSYTFQYMNEAIEYFDTSINNIVATTEEFDTYYKIKYVYQYGDGKPSDLSTFTFIKVKF